MDVEEGPAGSAGRERSLCWGGKELRRASVGEEAWLGLTSPLLTVGSLFLDSALCTDFKTSTDGHPLKINLNFQIGHRSWNIIMKMRHDFKAIRFWVFHSASQIPALEGALAKELAQSSPGSFLR